MLAENVKYCPRCGHELDVELRMGDLRPVCPQCEWIYFADPKVAAAILVERDDKVLLVRRVNTPKRGYWTLPAGFVDAGEDPAYTAVRECREETGLDIRIIKLLDVIYGQEHPRGAHFVIVYMGEIVSGELKPGDDADRAAFFPCERLPPLAFSTTKKAIAYHCNGKGVILKDDDDKDN